MRDMEKFISDLHAEMEEVDQRNDPDYIGIDVFLKRTEGLTDDELMAVMNSFGYRGGINLNLSLP